MLSEYIGATPREKVPLKVRKIRRSRPFCACTKYHPGLCTPFIHVLFNISIDGQWRPWSDCADAQADLGLRCPHDTRWHLFAWRGPDRVKMVLEDSFWMSIYLARVMKEKFIIENIYYGLNIEKMTNAFIFLDFDIFCSEWVFWLLFYWSGYWLPKVRTFRLQCFIKIKHGLTLS